MSDPFDEFTNGDESVMGTVFDLGEEIVELIPVTSKNKESIYQVAMGAYLEMPCRHCGVAFTSIQELEDVTVWDGRHPMHPDCWEHFKESDVFKAEQAERERSNSTSTE